MTTLTRRQRPQRRAPLLAAVAVTVFATLLAGCGGSAISPEEARAAHDGVNGSVGLGGPSAANPTGGPGEVPGQVPGEDPGTGDPVPGTPNQTGGPVAQPTGNTSGGPGTSKPPAVKSGSCAGFKNQKGITGSTIKLGNGADVSGPIPGIFTSAQQGAKAYVAYFNATSNLCGRKLELTTFDTRTDAGADQTAYTKMCDEDFASVGSMSVFDSGGAGTAQGCGLPDIRTASTTKERNGCSTCFGAQALGQNEFTNIADFYTKNFPAATKKAAMLYLSAGAAAENGKLVMNINSRRGYKYVYSSAIDVADFNYGPYVQQMKSKGVELVEFIGAYQQTIRLAQAMQSANFKPEVFSLPPAVYDENYVKSGGSAVEGSIVYVSFQPFEDPNAEQQLYLRWLQQVAPGATPSYFGMFAWSAAKLFVEESLKLGGKLTRQSLVAKLRGVNAWTGGGLHAPMQVGAKHPPGCTRFMRLEGGKWKSFRGSKYVCYGFSRG